MKIIKGDLVKMALNGEFDAIVHGCNCFNTMGSGIAKQIKMAFPEAYGADCATTKGDRGKLGDYSFAHYNGSSLVVFNAYIQYDYGSGKDRFEYDAFELVLKRFVRIDRYFKSVHGEGLRWGFPMIGCGHAGGDK